MKSWFFVKGYPKDLLESEMKKVKFTSKNRNTKRGKSLKAVPFVMTYHPKRKSMKKVVLKYLDLLYMDNEVKSVFTPNPMISFRSARKLSSYLVRAKLYPTERTVGSFQWSGKRYEICINVNETSTFTSTVNGETYIINHRFDCNKRCLVHLLTCNKCKSDFRKHGQGATCMQQHLFNHFCTTGHCGFFEDVSLTFIEKTDPSDPLKREDYWRSTVKTRAPYGLNIEESV